MAVTVCPFNEDLIDLVQNNPALYNCNLPGYKSDEYKLNTWQEIAERLGEDVEVCRRRWRSLRTRYRRELLKIERGVNLRKSKANTRTWIYFDKMGFLYDYLRIKENVTYALEAISSDEEEKPMLVPPDKKSKVEGPADILREGFSLEELNPITGANLNRSPVQEAPALLNCNGNGYNVARKNARLTSVELMNHTSNGPLSKPSRNLFDQFKPEMKEIDESEIFGRLIAAKMKKLENPIDLQIIILNMIKEHEEANKADD